MREIIISDILVNEMGVIHAGIGNGAGGGGDGTHYGGAGGNGDGARGVWCAVWQVAAVTTLAAAAAQEQMMEAAVQWGNEGQFLSCNTQFVS